MANIPPPPVPPRLREMLKDYPELIQKIQGDLNSLVEKMLRGPHFPPFEEAVWFFEGRLGSLIADTDAEVEAAKSSANPQAIERAEAKLHLMWRIRSDCPWNKDGGDQDLWKYFQTYKAAFE